MIYLLLLPLQLICMILCYLTNWFVCLFANEVGELPSIFRLWQTWDDCLDIDFHVKEVVPSFLRYDYDSKYQVIKQYPLYLTKYNRFKYGVKLKSNAHFSFKEKIQRYFCRVLWLMRNSAYGFAFYLFGQNINGNDLKIIKDTNNDYEHEDLFIAYDPTKNILIRPFMIKGEPKLIGKLYLNIFLGWKIDRTSNVPVRCMLAHRIAFRIK